MTADYIKLLHQELKQIYEESILYFDRNIETARAFRENQDDYSRLGRDQRFETEQEKQAAEDLTTRLITLMGKLSQG